jgi:hypothetical protein
MSVYGESAEIAILLRCGTSGRFSRQLQSLAYCCITIDWVLSGIRSGLWELWLHLADFRLRSIYWLDTRFHSWCSVWRALGLHWVQNLMNLGCSGNRSCSLRLFTLNWLSCARVGLWLCLLCIYQLFSFRVVFAVSVVFGNYTTSDLRKILNRAQRNSNLLGRRHDPIDRVRVERVLLTSFLELLSDPWTWGRNRPRSTQHVNLKVTLSLIRPCVNTSSFSL